MSTAIAVERLAKAYGGVRVLDDVTLDVAGGQLCALLGPNGAGKTTLVECLEGFRTPDAGGVRIRGLDPLTQRTAAMAHTGVMLQEGGAYPAATPAEMLTLYQGLHHAPADDRALLDRVGLGGVADTRYRHLSGGQKQRLNLALALVGEPTVLVLDEPTAGMDAHAREATWSLISELRRDGVAVLLTTHFLEEAERLADRVVVLDRGRTVASGSPAELVAGDRGGRVVVTTPAEVDPRALGDALGVAVTAEGVGRYVVAAGPEMIHAVSAWFAEAGLPLTGVTAEGGLHAVFKRLTEAPDQVTSVSDGPSG